jgi:hypothetical protein
VRRLRRADVGHEAIGFDHMSLNIRTDRAIAPASSPRSRTGIAVAVSPLDDVSSQCDDAG